MHFPFSVRVLAGIIPLTGTVLAMTVLIKALLQELLAVGTTR